MRAVMCNAFGPLEDLVIENRNVPQPGPGEVRIAIEAAGVNFPDTLMVEGKYQVKPALPFTPGTEIGGVVEAIGEGVTHLAVGMPVTGMVGIGAFAEAAVVRASRVMQRPAAMDAVTAAGFSMTYGTSMHALSQRADLRPGEVLLVLGASGGVGLAAVEIGKAMGATVIAAASSAEKLEVARKAGADHLINYDTESLRDRVKALTDGRGVDVVYDPVGGERLEEAVRVTAWQGRILVVGFASGTIPRIPANLLLLKGCALVGVFFGTFASVNPAASQDNFRQLFAWFEEGKLKPLISRTLDLADTVEALRLLTGRTAIGKIVLTTGRTA
ncbi:NADPH:quinone oxidoreductase family protein [Bosea sp. NBC_00550]|uniref:NADPH:quinone oxidoreductase family protein n=1 Tax=Bosea sp. NBC_00550 TaxID=2969621 RepID=UPI00222F7B5A|nr:NADPH:quinone oxidoreductase family protein [Bosea sp. NBC_00550]UZF95444.1 NADPH:quinone oxidoreductase family protein [Bosea sp. NBC_00550]